MNNGLKPIFPILDLNKDWSGLRGLTKREYFAGLAMQASDLEAYANKYGEDWPNKVAKDSILMADELLKQLGDGK